MSNVPGAVLRSLSGREDAFAEDLRLGCWSRGSLANQASSLVGCSGANAWRLRERLLASSVRRGLDSLRGVTGERADTLLAQYAEKAPKVVLLALAGRSDCVAHDLRQQLLNLDVGREVVASLRGLDDSTSWRLRERCHSRYPSTVIRSLHGISASEPSIELRRKCEQAGQGDLHTLRRSCGLDEHHRQVDAASWSVARTSKPIELQETA